MATIDAKHAVSTNAPPEPALTPPEILKRAVAMRPMLRDLQNSVEAAGCVSENTNAKFIAAGFYRILQPRCFGGYEFDLPTFLRVMIAVSRGPGVQCPNSETSSGEAGGVRVCGIGLWFALAMAACSTASAAPDPSPSRIP